MDFTKEILVWYSSNKRDLPWRKTTSPYKIWLSEIILQQTRIDQGLSYYNKFVNHYPTINDLAKASEDQVLKDWQGLGYYSRARNLHATAKYITTELDGNFPDEYSKILKLKGVGPYTAAAIASFAFKEQKAVVDGNVYRVLSRFFAIETPIDSTKGKKEFEELANHLIDSKIPDLYNHAIMDFGATQCTPKQPKCFSCPLESICEAKNKGIIDLLPKKEKKVKVTDRYFHFIVHKKSDLYLFVKRDDKGIWRNMYQFPLIETHSKSTDNIFDNMPEYELAFETKHILSHQRIHAKFWKTNNPHTKELKNKSTYFSPEEVALPRLIEKYLEQE